MFWDWLDDNLAGKKSETAGDNNLSLAIDISEEVKQEVMSNK